MLLPPEQEKTALRKRGGRGAGKKVALQATKESLQDLLQKHDLLAEEIRRAIPAIPAVISGQHFRTSSVASAPVFRVVDHGTRDNRRPGHQVRCRQLAQSPSAGHPYFTA